MTETRGRFCLGIDEAGTGAWAGPFCLGGTVFPLDFSLKAVRNAKGPLRFRDSKKLSPKKREAIRAQIEKEAVVHGVVFTYPPDIKQYGQGAAWQNAIVDLLKGLLEDLAEKEIVYGRVDVMVDGQMNHTLQRRIQDEVQGGLRVNFEPKGDEKYFAVCAASILAKTSRDDYMHDLHHRFPEYRFDTNVGYGTEAHAEALVMYGRTKYHRPLVEEWDLADR